MFWGQCESGALTNLEVNQVEVCSWLPREKAERLRERAIRRLAAAGIHQTPKTPTAWGNPHLIITFDAIDLSKTGPNALWGNTLPGKFLYRQKLEVIDYVSTKQNPGKSFSAVICELPGYLPRIVDDVPFEELGAHLDGMVDRFISRHKKENTE
jgi:hypothetical protein